MKRLEVLIKERNMQRCEEGNGLRKDKVVRMIGCLQRV